MHRRTSRSVNVGLALDSPRRELLLLPPRRLRETTMYIARLDRSSNWKHWEVLGNSSTDKQTFDETRLSTQLYHVVEWKNK
jgi:hypothetical protein